jgi:hypothetical protein
MPVLNNKSQSDRISMLQSKTIYADYLRQKKSSYPNRVNHASASMKEESTNINILQGSVFTTCAEVNCITGTTTAVVPSIVTTDLLIHFEANDTASYPGSGTTWINIGTGGSDYNATLAGPDGGLPVYVASPIKAFQFTRHATSDPTSYLAFNYIYLKRPPTIGDDFTYCAWIKTSDVGHGQNHYELMYIVSTETANINNDFGFGIDNNGNLAYGDGKNGGSDITIRTSRAVNTGTWMFVAVTRQKSTGRVVLYINGVADTYGTCNSGNSLDVAGDMLIGSEADSIGYTMGGYIAAVLGNTSVLSETDVLNNYKAQKGNYGY